MHGVGESAYGLWYSVLINIIIFWLFAYSAFKPSTKRDWRSLGAFTAFIIALFTEMFGYPLTIYLLTSVLGNKYPVLDPFTHANGHLWVALFGGSPIAYYILHPLSNVLIFTGLIIITVGWRKVHSGNGELVTDGIYKFIRHPQYSGFILMILGFLIQWPTIVTLIMAPVLLLMYIKLARREERELIKLFGIDYINYMHQVSRFFPKISFSK